MLSLHCPIALLGDHLQLPPICEVDNDSSIQAYWAKPSIFLEDAFRIGNNYNALHELKNHTHELTNDGILKVSYRFGSSLALILDRFIYRIGLEGRAEKNTTFECIDCTPFNPPNRETRQNHSEVKAIINRLERWWDWAQKQPDLPSIAILTPYKNQVKLIRREIRNYFQSSPIVEHVDVLNTHKSQGREWDCVFFSVSDTGNLQGNVPFLCDTNNIQGKAILNTTISRTKKHLRIFLDAAYWRDRVPASLITSLVRNNQIT